MNSLNKIENKIEEFLKEIEYLRGENTMLKLQLRSSNKTKDAFIRNNTDMHSKIKLALKSVEDKLNKEIANKG
jgi:cell division septum initiation protein DivIVA